MAKIEEPDPEETGTWVNQRRHEPLPASHHDEHGQSAVIRNEEHAEAHAEAHTARQPGEPDSSAGAVQPAQPAEHEPDGAGPGKAVRDMMPGPAPQGDVPDAPAVQIAATGNPGESGGTDDGEGKPGPVRLVSNAVPGKPDGEVDTRP